MKKLLLMLIAFVLLGATSGLVLAVGTNGSFETGVDPGSYMVLNATDSASITGWTVALGSVDYIGTYWTASNGTRSIDVNGNETGSVSQALATVAGGIYKVTFDMSGNPDGGPNEKMLRASAGSTMQDFSYDTAAMANTREDMKWQNETFSFVATGTNTTLTFASQISGFWGPVLDNVLVEQMTLTNRNQCMNEGWRNFGVFKNQGDCVSFTATGGRNMPMMR